MAKNNHKTVKSVAEKRKGKFSLSKFSFNKTEIAESDTLRKMFLKVNLEELEFNGSRKELENKQWDDEF